MRLGLTVLTFATIAVGSVLPIHGQNTDQTVTLEVAGARATGVLRLPVTPARPPVVCLPVNERAELLATALAADGVATLRVEVKSGSEEIAAHWIAWLRNDGRFPTVTIAADGSWLEPAKISGRAARADGILDSGDAVAIARFARTVPVLGRRGTSAARPATARRSPRQTILTTIDGVRIGIEWGAPQKRGRDIWGTLVKWDEIWMPGADESSTITTNGPIRIGAIDIPAGDHTIYATPGQERFQLIISKDVGQFHTVHDENLFIGRTDMTLRTRTDSVEGLTFAVEPGSPTAMFKLIWDTREYSAPLAVK